ncbi:MAG: glycosyltransferase family 2 protein [Nitrospinales bacterium]
MVEPSTTLSIVIVNYNSKDYLRDCLYSIRETAANLQCEIIVIDNRSVDGSVEFIRKVFPEVILIPNKINCGFSRACNQGIKISRSPYILLLNNDTVLLPHALETMISIMEKSPGIGLLGCKLLNTDRSLQQSFGRVTGFVNEFGRKYFINLYEKHKNSLVGKFLNWTHAGEKEVAWVKGACMLLRRQAILDADLMDENYFMYMEEVDLSIRIKQLGWKIVYTPRAQIVHHGGGSTATNSYRALVEYRKSQLYFYKKHYGKSGLLKLRIYLYCKLCVNYLGWWVVSLFKRGADSRVEERGRCLREIFKLVVDYH